MKEDVETYSPKGVLEDYFRSSDSETSSSKEPTADSENHQNSKPTSRWHGLVQLLRTKSKKPIATTMHPLMKFSKRMSSSMRGIITPKFQSVIDDMYPFKSPWKNFSLYELQAATKSFSHENQIGKGGYAEVYKGCLPSGQLVAIKRLTRGTPEEITGDFLAEIGIMAHVNHPNTARLIGYGVEGGMHLVLELSPKGSLASVLYGSKEKLDWGIRYKIALGAARGLQYLHEGCQRRIIHRDIKAANILLTEDFEAKICDFGLAKWLPEKWTHHTISKFEGTFGYLAPEFLLHGIVDEKTDVFAYGVVLLELVTGRRALDYSQQSLVLWAKPLLKKNVVKSLVDPSLRDEYNTRQMNIVLLVASACIQQSSIRRPSMNQVVQLLSGDLSSLKCMKKSRMSFYRKAFQDEHINTEDHVQPRIKGP
ncbi:PREDICTED: receptor-like cytosolic serine/threonine-protein kinase RBK2 [Prunus mume]|uniref:Receptor-like cytosolic serine/threonine-protein kinase RBK2 n=1 Tax=Prunus mume TaxID=102107 RepID=A0ABM1LT62_PRUMU|nr:PREDICTED: receptor-like cytosolic serine/threonine-protein kinase RBK2 [Prunus mume]XP_016650589.1 PREDICTED: receptor-like cytosolic serine/threonine-protein kinase RBK2 [Prunus mume]